MYNQELKERYIKDKNDSTVISPLYLERLFKKTADIERELGKDISNFTAYEIIDYLKTRNFSSLEIVRVIVSQLKMYTDWCMQENLVLDNQNHFMELDIQIMNDCVNKLILKKRVITKEQFDEWVNEMPNPKDKFILLCLFEFGKSNHYQDIAQIKLSDFNENELQLTSGRTVQVSDQLLRTAKETDEEIFYYVLHSDKKYRMKDIGYIVKYYGNIEEDSQDIQIGKRIYYIIVKSLSYLGVENWMSANAIVESGKIHMIKKRAAELGMTPKEYVYSPYIEEVNKQYDCKIVRSTFVAKYGDFL